MFVRILGSQLVEGTGMNRHQEPEPFSPGYLIEREGSSRIMALTHQSAFIRPEHDAPSRPFPTS